MELLVQLILNTGIGHDIDDVLTPGMIHALQSRGECRRLVLTISRQRLACNGKGPAVGETARP